MTQLDLDLTDTDAIAKRDRLWASRQRRLNVLMRAINERAWAIHNDSRRDQDTRILCPVRADGYYCCWVAGHYGGHNLGRAVRQSRYRD